MVFYFDGFTWLEVILSTWVCKF